MQEEKGPEIREKMRAAVIPSYGNLQEIISIQELPVPQISPNQVLVQVHATGANPVDIKATLGGMRFVAEWTFPRSVAYDLSGIIVAKGDQVDAKWNIGDEIVGQINLMQAGALCEYAALSTNRIYKKPTSLDWIQGAAIPCVSCTSYQALLDKGKIEKGNKVLILGGTTTTGMIGIQMAKKIFGASLVACTSRNEGLCRRLGADIVVNYREANWWEVLEDKFDIIYDCVGGYESWQHAQTTMVSGGRYVSLVGDDKHLNLSYSTIADFMAKSMNRGFWAMFGYPSWTAFFQDPTSSYSDYMPFYEDGTLETIIDERSPYSFDNEGVKQLYADCGAGTAKGKLVVKIRD